MKIFFNNSKVIHIFLSKIFNYLTSLVQAGRDVDFTHESFQNPSVLSLASMSAGAKIVLGRDFRLSLTSPKLLGVG